MTGPADGAGPIADEAVRLLQAARDWAHGFAAPGQPPPGDAVTCQVCPFCQGLALLRQARPETFDHLAAAARSFTLAVRSMAAAADAGNADTGEPAADPAGPGADPRAGRIQHIDVG